MIERMLYGPMEFLAPDQDFNAMLEIGGINVRDGTSYTVHVFLDEVMGDDISALVEKSNYAGSFSIPKDIATTIGDGATVLMDITQALRKAEQEKPNFHITFLVEGVSALNGERLFQFESVHIVHRVPGNEDLDISANVMCGLATEHKEPI